MSSSDVIVRMYRIGFGDAFLLLVPCADGVQRKILIDCGRHFQTPSKVVGKTAPPRREADIVERIVQDVTNDQGEAEIDLVIATHRHQDHISGFSSKLWEKVAVKEVWMPWTEDPTDPEASKLRRRHAALAARLHADGQRLGIGDQGFRGLVANSLSNESAMRTLHQGFATRARRRFLEGKMQVLAPAILPGVRVHVLGPSRDPEVIRDLDPPSGQSYLRARRARAAAATAVSGPFKPMFEVTEAQIRTLAGPLLVASKAQKAHLQELANGDPFLVAATLEKAINGTSLMLSFEIGKAMLLFPGDAQWGTWQRALASSKARAVLARTTFYKIGHHGSHNATPREFVEELLGDNLRAMASVWPIARFPRIPKLELMSRLAQKRIKVARADAPPERAGFQHDDGVVETKVPTR